MSKERNPLKIEDGTLMSVAEVALLDRIMQLEHELIRRALLPAGYIEEQNESQVKKLSTTNPEIQKRYGS